MADLVAPCKSSEILSIISSLSKIYAQRLISRACVNRSYKSYTSSGERQQPISVDELLDSYNDSIKDGTSTGFFMHPLRVNNNNRVFIAGLNSCGLTFGDNGEYYPPRIDIPDITKAEIASQKLYDH